MICHKLGKKYIILDTLSKLVNANINYLSSGSNYKKLNVLFIYKTTLIKVNPKLFPSIRKGYKADSW